MRDVSNFYEGVFTNSRSWLEENYIIYNQSNTILFKIIVLNSVHLTQRASATVKCWKKIRDLQLI